VRHGVLRAARAAGGPQKGRHRQARPHGAGAQRRAHPAERGGATCSTRRRSRCEALRVRQERRVAN
jgi:hypothetical protein